MSHMPAYLLWKLAIGVLASALIVLPGHAQEEEQAPPEEAIAEGAATPEAAEPMEPAQPTQPTKSAEMEEIIVIAPKPGSRRRVDTEYEDPARAKLLKEFYRMKELDEEYAWRQSTSTDSSSRMQWGYDPRDEYRMRNDTALQDLPSEKTKPATVFRVEF